MDSRLTVTETAHWCRLHPASAARSTVRPRRAARRVRQKVGQRRARGARRRLRSRQQRSAVRPCACGQPSGQRVAACRRVGGEGRGRGRRAAAVCSEWSVHTTLSVPCPSPTAVLAALPTAFPVRSTCTSAMSVSA